MPFLLEHCNCQPGSLDPLSGETGIAVGEAAVQAASLAGGETWRKVSLWLPALGGEGLAIFRESHRGSGGYLFGNGTKVTCRSQFLTHPQDEEEDLLLHLYQRLWDEALEVWEWKTRG